MQIFEESFTERDERGEWHGVKLFIHDDFYIQVGCRGKDAEERAKHTADQLRAGLMQVVEQKYEENRKPPR